jgi:hypothetical protein
VNGLKMPLAYADQFYVLREHIGFVRERLTHSREAQRDAAGEPDEPDEPGDPDEPGESGDGSEPAVAGPKSY